MLTPITKLAYSAHVSFHYLPTALARDGLIVADSKPDFYNNGPAYVTEVEVSRGINPNIGNLCDGST